MLTSAGDGRVASASRDDYAEGAAVALTLDDPAGLYRFSGDHAWSQAELAADLSQVLGTAIEVNEVSPEQQTEILTGAGLDAGLAGFVVGVDAAIKAGELSGTSGDLAKLIGRPTIPLVDTLRAAL